MTTPTRPAPRWQDIIHAKVTGRHRPSWDTRGNVLTHRATPADARKIVRPLPSGRPAANFLPIGVDEHNDQIGWDLTCPRMP